jgi:hypothetical protein
MSNTAKDWESTAERIRSAGYSVQIEGATLVVHLPTFCSLLAEGSPASPIFRAKFGFLGRRMAAGATVVMVVVYLLAYSKQNVLPLWLAVAAVAWDLPRWVITQRALTDMHRIVKNESP